MYCNMLTFSRYLLLIGLVLHGTGRAGGGVVDFEELGLQAESYWNGSDGSGEFTSGEVVFKNNYNTTYGSWSGWSYSNTTDADTAGFTNQYSAYTGGGVHDSSNYGVYYDYYLGGATVTGIPAGELVGAYFTNTTYAALSMLNGDSFAKKFGGDDGSDPDYFKLTIKDSDPSNQTTVDFYLADYRFADNNEDYIVDEWTWVDLSDLGSATQLQFSFESSDTGGSGMNTPAYFAMDNLTLGVIPEPSSLLLMLCGAAAIVAVGRRRKRQSV